MNVVFPTPNISIITFISNLVFTHGSGRAIKRSQNFQSRNRLQISYSIFFRRSSRFRS